MKPFNLEEAKAGKPVVTRDGRPVRILAFDRKGDYCIVAIVSCWGSDEVIGYRESGKSATINSEYDLFMKLEKKEGWVNVYRGGSTGDLYSTEDAAKRSTLPSRIATVKVEWEE